MPITLPNLDDRRFDDLVAEARALIPSLAPEWTDHNPSDPGITLVELFAYLSEILIYRLNRVTDANTRAFLQLLNGPPSVWQPSNDLDADIRATIQTLRTPDRAVTPADFEFLARQASVEKYAKQLVARATCVPRRDLSNSDRATADAPGDISVVVLPVAGADSDDVLGTVRDYLESRRLITTRLHVVPPKLVFIGVNLTLWLQADALPDAVLGRAKDALKTFLHPLTGGADGQGWPFGRPVYVSEIYRLLDRVPGVDYVEPTPGQDEVVVFDSSARIFAEQTLGSTTPAPLVGIRLSPNEVVVVDETALPLALIASVRKRS